MNKFRLAFLMALALLVLIPAGLALAQEVDKPADTAVIWDNLALSDAITYKMSGVVQPAPGRAYEGWLKPSDGSLPPLSTGVMTVAADGTIDHTFTSPTGANFMHLYDQVVITDEPVPDPDPAPSGMFIYSHEIPAGGIAHIRHLLTNWPPGADRGILTNLKLQLDAAILHATLAANADTLDAVKLHAHHVINIIEGADGSNYDASFGDPGDGLGVLSHAADRKHGPFAASAAADDPVIVARAALVDLNGKNVEDWAIQARDQALVVIGQSALFSAKLQLIPVAGILTNARNGIDSDGDGTIESIAGEGGAAQAYVEAQLMATYTLEPGGLPVVVPVEEVVVQPVGPGLPSVGDSSVGTAVWGSLIGALVLLGAGGALLARGRRSRTRA